MAKPFFVTPGETVLLGLCLEEYGILRKEIENWPFHASVKQRIDPFVPDLRYTRGSRIDPTSVPKDVKWIKGEGEECGTSPQYPNTVFVRNDRGVFRQDTDVSRRNLVVLLLLYLDDAVGLSPPYREFIEGQGHIGIAWNELHEKYRRAMQDAGDNYHDSDEAADDPSRIERLVMELASFNQTESLLSLGRDFGRLVGGIRLFQWKRPLEVVVPLILRGTLNLHQTELVRNSSFCLSALTHLSERLFGDELEQSVLWQLSGVISVEGWKPPTIDEMKQLITSVQRRVVLPPTPRSEAYQQERFAMAWSELGVALGDAIGRLHEGDSSAQTIEYSLPSPRAYLIAPGDSIDKILSFLTDAEKELNESPAIPHLAERTVVSLVTCLEPLSKRVWKKEFNEMIEDRYTRRKRKRGFAEVLRIVKESPVGSEERRFAELAQYLYSTYRCPAAHDLDSFSCSFEEARHVLSAVRLLVHLSESLRRKFDK